MKYDIERLNQINIADVLEALGAKPSRSKKLMHCCNTNAHKHGDKNPSMAIKADSNICKCFVCNLSGNPVTVAKKHFNDFKKGCEWLHATFNIPFLTGEAVHSHQPIRKNEIRYREFDSSRKYRKILSLKPFFPQYHRMSDRQKLKLAYTYVYRFSLNTDQTGKVAYYKTRALGGSKYIGLIGYLMEADILVLTEKLKKLFPIKDLIRFKLLNDNGQWKYAKVPVSVVPNFDLYSDMVEGFMLRYTDNRQSGKEINISCTDIVFPVPFGLGVKTLKSPKPIWLTEGHIDGLSIAYKGKHFASFGGVYAYNEELLGLFRGKTVVIAFDQDEAGIKAKEALAKKLVKAGATVKIAVWKQEYGKDLNDLLKNGNMKRIEVI